MVAPVGSLSLGSDVSCTTDVDPYFATVQGVEVVRQAAARRMASRLGSLMGDPTYGYDLQELLSSSGNATTIAASAAARIRQQMLRDERILTCTIVSSVYDVASKRLTTSVRCVTALGTFDLVFDLSATGIALVTGAA